jgi:hypothetical protein
MEKLSIEKREISLVPFTEFAEQVTKGTEILNGLTVVNSLPDLENSMIGLNKGKQLIGLIDKQVEAICRPLKDMKKEIDDVQRKVKEAAELTYKPIQDVVEKVEAGILDFNKKQREAAEKLRKEQSDAAEKLAKEQREKEAEQKRLEAEALKNNTPPPPPIEPAPVKEIIYTPVPTPAKVKGLTSVWKYEIIDVSLLPAEYLMPDTAKITAVVKAGIREIPGVRIYDEQIIRKS